MKNKKTKFMLCAAIVLWGSAMIISYSDGFSDVIGILMIIFGTALYFTEPN